MAQREASIYLYLFILMLILFAVMTVLFLSTNAEKTRITGESNRFEKDFERQEQDNRRNAEEITKLKVLIGGPSYSDGPWPGEEHFRQEALQSVQEKINEAIKFAVSEGIDEDSSARQYDYLTAPYEDMPSLLLLFKNSLVEARAARRESDDTRSQETVSHTETIDVLRTESSGLRTTITGLESRVEDLDNKSQEKEQDYLQQIEEVKDNWSDEVITLKRELNFKDNQIRSLQNRLDKLLEETRKEKSFDDVEPDGTILAVLSDSGKAWINLGRRNLLRKGLVFRVFQFVKGGKRLYKGRMEVRKVDERMSEMRVIEEVDSLNPIAKGDFVASPFYDPESDLIFVFAGTELESGRITRDNLGMKMESYGAKIGDKVDLSTDYLVAMKNYESSPEYRTARELGVTVIRERDLLEFIGR